MVSFFWACFLEEILEFHGRLGGWSMNMARWPMADILVQRLKLELRVLDDGYAAADYFWMGSLLSRLDQGHHRRYEMHTPRCFQGVQYWGTTTVQYMSDKSSQGPLLSSNRCCYLRLGTDIGFPSELKNKMLTNHSFAVYADYNYYVPGILWYIALQRPTASLLSLPFTSLSVCY